MSEIKAVQSEGAAVPDSKGCPNGFDTTVTTDSQPFTSITSCYDDENGVYVQLKHRYGYVFNLAGQQGEEDAKLLQSTWISKVYIMGPTIPKNSENISSKKTLAFLEEKIKQIEESSKEDEDSVLVCILYKREASSNDLKKVWEKLKKCKNLLTKPKIFFFMEYDSSTPVKTDSLGTKLGTLLHIPSHSDFLLIHGFGEGYVKCLCDAIDDHITVEDLVSIVTIANLQASRRNKTFANVPYFNNMLTHEIRIKVPAEDVVDAKKYDELRNERHSKMTETQVQKAENVLGEVNSYITEHPANKSIILLAVKKDIEEAIKAINKREITQGDLDRWRTHINAEKN